MIEADSGAKQGGATMHERVVRLEGNYAQVTEKISGLSSRMDGFDVKIDRVISILSEQKAKQPPSFQTMLTTAGLAASLVAAGGALFFFLVDARVGAAVTNTNKFVEDLNYKGAYWVQMDRINNRLDRLEAVIADIHKKRGAGGHDFEVFAFAPPMKTP